VAQSTAPFLDDQDFKDFLREFQAESDRAAAILAAAYLDDLLGRLLLASFVDDTQHCRHLVDGDRALSSFSARIPACYAFGLLSESERFDLDQVRGIRNRFAHERHGLTFVDESISAKCGTFKCIEETLQALPGAFGTQPPQAPKTLFVMDASLLGFYLRSRVSHAKRTLRPMWPLWQPWKPEQGA
jgi:DNA-binding MltR family transcriptional regulator